MPSPPRSQSPEQNGQVWDRKIYQNGIILDSDDELI